MRTLTRRFGLPGGLRRVAAITVAMVGLSGCVVYEHPVPYTAPAAATPVEQTCREYRTTATIDGTTQQLLGTACLQPDGTWRFIR